MEEKKDFGELYHEFEEKYNKYPVQMAPYEAFRYAKDDGLITEKDYADAAKYFGKRWNYTGD